MKEVREGLANPAYRAIELKESYVTCGDSDIENSGKYNVVVKIETDSNSSLEHWFLSLDCNYESLISRFVTKIV